MKYANDDNLPHWKGEEEVKQIEVTFIGDKPYIKAAVNEQTELLFLIDSGASFTVLNDSEKVKRLSLKKGFEFFVGGWGDEEQSTAYQTTAASIAFAGIVYLDFKLAVIPLNKTKYFLSKEEMIYDGVIGHDILRNFSWTINRQQQQIFISQQPYKKKNNEVEVPFDTFMSKLSIPIEVNFGGGHIIKHEAIIDTGSRHYLKLSSAFAEDYSQYFQAKISATDFGLSGAAQHERVSLPNLSIANISYQHIKTNLIESDDEDDWWVIGNALLSQGEYTLDYLSSKLILAPRQENLISSRYNLLGLELRKLTTGNFIVRYVFPNLPASQTNITVGTVLTAIDDIPAKDISENAWLDITNTSGKHTLCAQIDTRQCWQIDAKEILGYSTPISL